MLLGLIIPGHFATCSDPTYWWHQTRWLQLLAALSFCCTLYPKPSQQLVTILDSMTIQEHPFTIEARGRTSMLTAPRPRPLSLSCEGAWTLQRSG